jgi:hypothetical protein
MNVMAVITLPTDENEIPSSYFTHDDIMLPPEVTFVNPAGLWF